jgi:hypothetical protein
MKVKKLSLKQRRMVLLILAFSGLGLSGCNELMNDGGYYDNSRQRGGYQDSGYGNNGYGGGYGNNGYGNGGYNNGYNQGYYDRQERDNLERERRRIEDERRRLEEERNRPVYAPPAPPPPPVHVQRPPERCPSGFSPSENKCSQQERRRGCRDMRLPGGLGCVSR